MTDIATLVASLRDTDMDDTELTGSIKQHGWIKGLPAIQDENGVTLVGNRRMRIARELGITPEIWTIAFGAGPDAEAGRLKLAVLSNLGGEPLSQKVRARLAKQFYSTGKWTQQAIADKLGVSQYTISKDLGNLLVTNKSKHTKTATNPKGSGRPKGSKGSKGSKSAKPPKATPQLDKAREIIRPIIEAGEPLLTRKLQDEHGISHAIFETAYHAESILRDASSPIDWSTAPGPVQDKIKAVIERERAKLKAEIERDRRVMEQAFDERVIARAKEIIEATMLPAWRRELSLLVAQVTNRKPVLTERQFKRVYKALHDDTWDKIDKSERAESFQTWHELKNVLVGEKENPIAGKYKLPSSVDDLMKMRAAASAARKASARRPNRATPARTSS
jgi:hypothetical protein